MTKNSKSASKPDDGQTYIYRPYRRLPDGTVLWAKNFGLKAWKIPVTTNDNEPDTADDSKPKG